MIGHINLGMKQTGERNAGKPHVAFDAAGAGNGFTNELVRHSQRKQGATDRLTLRIPRQSSTLPTSYAELITQATTAYNQYKAFVSNVEHFTWKQGWQTTKNQLEHVPFKDVFGETAGFDVALTTNNGVAAQAAWANSTEQVDSGATTYLASQTAGGSSRSQLGDD